jgi:hypothetical protein
MCVKPQAVVVRVALLPSPLTPRREVGWCVWGGCGGVCVWGGGDAVWNE